MRYAFSAMTILVLLILSMQSQAKDNTCRVAQLTARLDSRNGDFDGMSQSGILLILRNIDKTSCMLASLPTLTFEDTEHHPFSVTRRLLRGMHPGPVLLPVSLAPGQAVSTRLHWVSNDVFDAGNCVSPAFITLAIKGETLRMPFERMMCAAAGKNTYFDQPPFYPMSEPEGVSGSISR